MFKNTITFTDATTPVCTVVSGDTGYAKEILRYENGLTVTRIREYYPAFDATYERHYVENTGSETILVENFVDGEMLLPFAPVGTSGLLECTAGCARKVVRLEGMIPGELYWKDDINCARTTLTCLSELFDVSLEAQTIKAAVGLHGAGG